MSGFLAYYGQKTSKETWYKLRSLSVLWHKKERKEECVTRVK